MKEIEFEFESEWITLNLLASKRVVRDVSLSGSDTIRRVVSREDRMLLSRSETKHRVGTNMRSP